VSLEEEPARCVFGGADKQESDGKIEECEFDQNLVHMILGLLLLLDLLYTL